MKTVIRVLVYSSLAFIVYVFVRNAAEFSLTQLLWDCEAPGDATSHKDAGPRREHAIEVIRCMRSRGGFFALLFLREDEAMSFLAPVTPCEYVGRWRSIRPIGQYDIELDSGGRFAAQPAPGYSGAAVRGWWSVAGKSIQWVYESPFRPWRPDINPIVDEQSGQFVLVEENGMRTLFQRLQPSSGHCVDAVRPRPTR